MKRQAGSYKVSNLHGSIMGGQSRLSNQDYYSFGPFEVDTFNRTLVREGAPVPLTSKAFDTLVVLLEGNGRVLDKEYLMKAVWPDTIVEENNLSQTISALRKTLGPSSTGKSYIETLHGRGYRFVFPAAARHSTVTTSIPGNLEQTDPISKDVSAIPAAKTGIDATAIDAETWRLPPTPTPTPVPDAFQGSSRARRGLAIGVAVGLALIGIAVMGIRRYPSRSRSAELHLGIPALSQGKFLAVLPFTVNGDKASLDYVAQGLAGGLASTLLEIPNLHVTSATAVERADTSGSLEGTAQQLGANLLVRGTLEGDAQKIRLLVSLEDVPDGKRMWSEKFSGSPRDVPSLENQIYLKVSGALGIEAAGLSSGRVNGRFPENFEAYDLFLKGNDAIRHRDDVNSVEAAVRFYQEALTKEPDFALGYAGLADASLEMYRLKKDSFWAERAVVSAEQAARLDDSLAEVHFALGNIYEATGKITEAIAEDKRGLELAPKSDEGYRHLAHAYLDQGNKEQALAAYQTAIDIDPYYWFNFNALGYAYFQLGDFAKALSAFQRVVQIEPVNPYGYDNIGAVYLSQGKWAESISMFEKALQLRPHLVGYSNLGTAYFHLRRYSDAAKMFEKAVEISPNQQLVLGNLADAYRWSGQSQKAESTYDKAISLAYEELQVNPRSAATMQTLALYYAKKGDRAQALEFINRARSLDSENVQLIYSEAEVRTLAGQTTEALSALRQAFQRGYSPQEASVDPELDKLRSDPGFQSLIEAAKRNSKT